MTRSKQQGFSFIELMVAVAILALLAGIIAPRVLDKFGDAQGAKARTDIQGINSAIKLYMLDNYQFPTTDEGIEALVTKPGSASNKWKALLDKVPKDPWGNPYRYMQPGQHGDFDVYTYGADNQAGGEGKDADIGNWDL